MNKEIELNEQQVEILKGILMHEELNYDKATKIILEQILVKLEDGGEGL